ncbi:MAG TPA: glycerate kinase [candidate division Zixibacteria bacterium]|nr:glycerate kinase [candidate division Zixibacteria bacterium]
MLSVSRLRKDARTIFEAAVRGADPAIALRRSVRTDRGALEIGGREYRFSNYRRVCVIGAGKASARMAEAVEALLGDRIVCGTVVVKYGHSVPLERIEVREAAHPIPDPEGVRAARAVAEVARQAGERDLVFCLWSGGGSALLVDPAPGVTLEDKQRLVDLLLRNGVPIEEINALRKHLSRIKGGQLARLAQPATVAAVILADVIGDPIGGVASGPTAPDPSTFADCLAILERHGLLARAPQAVLSRLESGARGEIEETPKPGEAIFERVHNVVIADNATALAAAKEAAEALGYHTWILTDPVTGEAREAGARHARTARAVRAGSMPLQPPACIISGGETTVTVRGPGRGGRNQEFALAFALEIDGLEGTVLLSAGTDGIDGPTDAAGAVADGQTAQRAAAAGIDPRGALERNDSYSVFRSLGDLIVTGPTRTNVMDVQLLLVG